MAHPVGLEPTLIHLLGYALEVRWGTGALQLNLYAYYIMSTCSVWI